MHRHLYRFYAQERHKYRSTTSKDYLKKLSSNNTRFRVYFLAMFSLNPLLPIFIIYAIEAILYLAIIGTILRRGAKPKGAVYLGALYAFLALLVQSATSAWQANYLPKFTAFTLEQIYWLSSLWLSFLLLIVLYFFLEKKKSIVWMSIGIFWVALLIALHFNLFQLPDIIWSNETWKIPRARLGFAISTTGWLIFSLGAFFSYRKAYKNTRQPLHRNRLRYWLFIFAFSFGADALFINNFSNWGAPLRLIGAGLLSYVVITHHLPDLQQFIRGALIYISTTLLAGAFYVFSFILAQNLFSEIVKNNPVIIGALIAILLATFFRPLYNFVEKIIDRWLGIDKLDINKTISDYSQSISNILNVERLANVTVSLIMEMMGIQRGFLFIVDKEIKKNGDYYALRAIRNAGERPISVTWLEAEGAIAEHFIEEQRPLLQFDLDLLPRFNNARPEEKNWLKNLDADVYVPVFSKNEWIGLFALGEKISGNRYSKENLLTLGALASQTAVALENARLVDSLKELNNKIRDAYRDLESTKRDLEKIDRTKSDFISIASHELRTPLTVMRGYTEMMLENPSLDEMMLKMLKGIHDGTMRLHEIMESLFDIAQIDARTLELEFEPINVGKLVRDVSQNLSPPLKERGQNLGIDLPPLPGIQADPDTLKKVFYHLISNAIKFTPDKGKIIIRGRTLPYNNDLLPDGGLEIIVSDTGIGINPNFTEVIFTKFYQPNEQLNKHSTGKTKFKGSGVGLGLALSRGIVEAHGGKIWVESSGYDEINLPGSHFHVILPLRKHTEGNTLPISDAIRLVI